MSEEFDRAKNAAAEVAGKINQLLDENNWQELGELWNEINYDTIKGDKSIMRIIIIDTAKRLVEVASEQLTDPIEMLRFIDATQAELKYSSPNIEKDVRTAYEYAGAALIVLISGKHQSGN